MIIKCKMCGGDIDFIPGATYGTCEYCGSTSTIPQAEDENKLNRYNRANHFRRQCEFDKAVAAYEKILEQDDTDARRTGARSSADSALSTLKIRQRISESQRAIACRWRRF